VSARDAQPTAAGPLLLRRMNERSVLETVREQAPISRAAIARAAGISKPTVSLALRALLEAGLVRQAPPKTDGPTYGATFFEADPEAAAVFAIDIGARYLRLALADVTGAVRAREDVETGARSADAVFRVIPRAARRLVKAAGVDGECIACAVVGVPGVVEPETGRLGLAENVPGLAGVEIAARIERFLRLPVAAENDVNLAAIGERDRGVARDVANFAFVSVGTGLGAGLVVDGELVVGSHGAAGELDLARPADTDLDPAAPAISEYARERAASLGAGATTVGEPFDTISIFDAARAGDALALEIVDEVARRICAHLVAVCAVVDPELIVIGGGIGGNADLLLPRVRELLAAGLPYPPRIAASALGGEVVLAGALAVGLARAREWAFTARLER